MEKDRIISVLKRLIALSKDIFGELNKASVDNNDLCTKIESIATLTSSVKRIVPNNVYEMYDEFFVSFIQLSNTCKDSLQLRMNTEVYRESVQLFSECLESIINTMESEFSYCPCCEYEGQFEQLQSGEYVCPNCKATAFDRCLITFLEDAQIKLAEEGFEVINISHRECIRNWMKYYCPQVKYIEADLVHGTEKDKSIIVSEKEVEIEGYYTHQINCEGHTSLFILSRNQHEDFDFSWKWKIDEELCENGPLVSVVLPCYNHEEFVAAAIESVINQSYKNIEFLVADDGSSDKTAEIMKKYEKYYAKSLYFKENAGGRMLELKELATGKYVAMMHSDDIWHEDKLAMQVEYMEKHPECGACLTWCRNVDQYGNVSQDQLFIQPNREREEWMRFFWENGNALCNPSSLTRRELFYNRLWQGYTGRQLPDYFKWIDMVQHHSIHIVTKELTFMRRYQNEKVENTSADSKINTFNLHVELGINWPLCLRDMEDEFFINTFKSFFIKKDASTKEELMCEKYFLMLNSKSHFIQNGALVFFNDFYLEIKECLEQKYDYPIRNYVEDARTKGLMDLLKGVAY